MESLIKDTIVLYQDLNASTIDILESEPSPLEFMRYVARNRPFVTRNAIISWPAFKSWSANYLAESLLDAKIKVALTPFGNADAPVLNPIDGKLYFVKPLEREVLFRTFLDQVRGPSVTSNNIENGESSSEVCYAQTQNDNLRGEYSALFPDVLPSIPWAQIALQKEPDAVNLWIGNEKSVTALHRDNYENIYCQVRGQKHFLLIPPTEAVCVKEKFLEQATYERDFHGRWKIQKDEGSEPVPCATWDPDNDTNQGYEQLCRPLRVTLHPGDLLYLPALWYHKVSQSIGEDDICVAVNYWYDMDFDGHLYPSSHFFREAALKTHSGSANE